MIMAESKEIFLGSGDLGMVSCYRRSKSGNCYHGSGLYTGCEDTCAYAAVPNSGDLVLAGQYTLEGNVVDYESEKPIERMLISLILPTGKRYSTYSDGEGRFRIIVQPDPRIHEQRPLHVALDFARMDSSVEENEIILVGEFTSAFRRTHPELTYLNFEVAKFDGETIKME
jgi:hypothetical protein